MFDALRSGVGVVVFAGDEREELEEIDEMFENHVPAREFSCE